MKTCLITGVSKGLGKALALKFKKEGFTVAGISRSKPDFNIDYHIQVDLTDKNAVEEIYEKFSQKYNRLDVLINNAGIGLYDSWENTKEEDLRKLFEINFFKTVLITQKFLPFLKETKGSVINVSSVAGKIYVPFMGTYCSSKFALNAFSDSLRAELKPYEVHVLNLIVGRINTGFSSRALGSLKPPETPSFGGSAEKFSEVVFKAYKKKKREITFPYWYKFLIVISKIFPYLYDNISLKSWKK